MWHWRPSCACIETAPAAGSSGSTQRPTSPKVQHLREQGQPAEVEVVEQGSLQQHLAPPRAHRPHSTAPAQPATGLGTPHSRWWCISALVAGEGSRQQPPQAPPPPATGRRRRGRACCTCRMRIRAPLPAAAGQRGLPVLEWEGQEHQSQHFSRQRAPLSWGIRCAFLLHDRHGLPVANSLKARQCGDGRSPCSLLRTCTAGSPRPVCSCIGWHPRSAARS